MACIVDADPQLLVTAFGFQIPRTTMNLNCHQLRFSEPVAPNHIEVFLDSCDTPQGS